MAMEERDRIDIIATLHDRFNKPADEIIRKMERMERQADETGDQIDDLEDSLDRESRTTRENTKHLDENTKARGRHGDALDDEGKSLARSTRDLHANTDAVRDSLSPTRKSTEARRDAAKAAGAHEKATRDLTGAQDDSNVALTESRRVLNASTRATNQARDAMGRFVKMTDDSTESIRRSTRATKQASDERERHTKATEKDTKSWTKWDTKVRKITSSIGGRFRPIGAFFQNYFKILGTFRALLFSDIGSMIPQLITGIVAIGSAANASLAPMGRLLGNMGQLAPLIAAFVQTQTVVKMAIGGVSDALKVLNDEKATLEDLNKAQKELGDNTWNTAKAVKQIGEEFAPIKKAVRETFLEGMAPAIMGLSETYFPLLRKELTRTAEIMNGELREGMKGLQTPEKQATIADVMERSSVASGLFVDIMWSLLDVFIELADAAGPAFLDTLESIDGLMDRFAGWIRDNKDGLTDFFNRANDTAGNFFRGIGFILLGLSGIASAAKPLEEFLYGGLVDRLEAWSERMNSPEGQEEMAKNYEAMIPNLEAIGNLIGAIVDGAKEVATSDYFAPLVNDLANNGIPLIFEYIKKLDETVGPPLLRMSEALNGIDPDVLTSILNPLGDALGLLAWALELVVPLFNALPKPMQETVMYGAGLAAMGLPGVFMMLLGPLRWIDIILKSFTDKGLLARTKDGFEKLKTAMKGFKDTKLGKWLGTVAGKLKAFFKPIGDFMKKHLTKSGGGILTRIFGKIAGKSILAVLGPVGAVIGVLWLLWDVISWLWQNVEPFRNFMTGIWDWIVQAWSASIDWIINSAVPWVVGAFQAIWEGIKTVGEWIANFYSTWIKPVFDAIVWLGKLIFVVIGTAIITPFYLLWKLIGPIVTAVINAFQVAIPLALNVLKSIWTSVLTALSTFWSIIWTNIKTVFSTIWGNIKLVWSGAVAVFQWGKDILALVVGAIVYGFVWLGQRIAAIFGWIKDNVVMPVVNWFASWVVPLFKWVVGAIGSAFVWVRDKITSVFNWIKNVAIAPATNWFRDTVWPIFRNVLNALKDKFVWARDKIGQVWDWIKNKIYNVYTDHISPTIEKFKAIIGTLKDSFNIARDAIGKAWDDIRDRAKEPIAFVVDKVYNEGIRPVWNKLSEAVDLGKTLEPVEWAKNGYDRGGWTGPGSKYQEAGVVHADEFVIKKSSQRSLRRDAPGFLDALNDHGSRALGYDSGGLVKLRPPFAGTYPRGDGFGARGGRHKGIDYPMPSGATLKAVGAGHVRHTRNLNAGNKLELVLGNGLVAGYHHLSSYIAANGSSVGRGADVARVGSTGRSSGPHLHFSLKKDGVYVDPAPYLGGGGAAGTGGGGGWGWVNPFDGLLDGFLEKIPGLGGFKDIGVGLIKKMVNGAKDWAVKHMDILGGTMDSVSEFVDDAKGAAGTARWALTATRALKHTGDYSAGNLASLLRRMNQESGGNPNAVNNWDSNARSGNASRGLMQVIPPTFRANRDPSLSNNIFDPMANIVASINYTKRRYRSLQAGWNRRGGYFNGGLVDHMRFMGGPVETWGNTLVGEFGPEIFMPSSGGAPSILGLTGPELVSFDREGSVLPHEAVAALSTVSNAPAYGGGDTIHEDNNYSIEISVGSGATEIDVERAVKSAIRDIERKKRERR